VTSPAVTEVSEFAEDEPAPLAKDAAVATGPEAEDASDWTVVSPILATDPAMAPAIPSAVALDAAVLSLVAPAVEVADEPPESAEFAFVVDDNGPAATASDSDALSPVALVLASAESISVKTKSAASIDVAPTSDPDWDNVRPVRSPTPLLFEFALLVVPSVVTEADEVASDVP
jgi:hypothetical protein